MEWKSNLTKRLSRINNVIFSAQQGEGFIAGPNDVIKFEAETIFVGEKKIETGEKTSLLGFFSRPLKYMGVVEGKYVFYMGDHDGMHYYQTLSIISPTRIYLNYAWSSGRDWNLVKGKWK
ncbi:hypothetical protein [Sphingobacterium sp. LRF_L2]|uniref:hypothetical protein n=1 Tax=Sphingobacterium sp. LRF_L2 TaxID=3369421 RepID=UPI003F5E4BEA